MSYLFMPTRTPGDVLTDCSSRARGPSRSSRRRWLSRSRRRPPPAAGKRVNWRLFTVPARWRWG